MSERMKRKGSTRTSFYEQQPEEVGAYEKIPKRTNIHQLNVGHRLMSIKKESDDVSFATVRICVKTRELQDGILLMMHESEIHKEPEFEVNPKRT